MIEDKTYKDAAPEAIGRFIGEFFTGLLKTMTREEAMVITITYVQELMRKPKDDSDNKM